MKTKIIRVKTSVKAGANEASASGALKTIG